MNLPARLISVPSGKVLLIDVTVSLSIFSLPLGIVMAGLARIRLSAVCLRPKRPDLYIGGENKAH